MARPLRVEFEDAFYHVINRGNAGEDIFKSRPDRKRFLFYLEKASERYSLNIHAYCLMTNHYHLVVETPLANLSRAIQWINVSYATYFNRKYHRSGHLFRGRFKSILVQADAYLKQLSRYIHLNPLRANIVGNIDAYKWSSYPAYICQVPTPAWLCTDLLLGMFSPKRMMASQKYREFVELVNPRNLADPSDELVGGYILGDDGFVDWIKTTFSADLPVNDEMPQLGKLRPKISVSAVVAAVCDYYSCEADTIRKKGAKKNKARDTAIYLARELTPESGVALGEYFGNISGAGITVRYNHFLGQIAKDKQLKRCVTRIRKNVIEN